MASTPTPLHVGRTPGLDGGYGLQCRQKRLIGHGRQRLDTRPQQFTFLDWKRQLGRALFQVIHDGVLSLWNGEAVTHQFWLLGF